MVTKHCKFNGMTPKLYADPHRVICKYLVLIEKLVLKQVIVQRKENVKSSLQIQDIQVDTLNPKIEKRLVHKKTNSRHWKHYKIEQHRIKNRGTFNQLEEVELKRRGVSTMQKRVYQNLGSRLKTPNRVNMMSIKRNSLFNENTRRPINTLTAPK